MAESSAPSPLPVTEPTELDDAEFAVALHGSDDFTRPADPSPRADQVWGALERLSAQDVAVSILCLGTDYHAGKVSQGYYFVGAKVDRRALQASFLAMDIGPIGVRRTHAAQLALSLALVPEAPHETRRAIAGWYFRESM